MVIDSSALIAILSGAAAAARLVEAINADPLRFMSVANYVECSIVLDARRGREGIRDLDHFVAMADIELQPVDVDQGRVARNAWSRFGKGRHAAGLNYGDCFAYALAHVTGEPLLFTGGDFGLTDVAVHAESARRN